MVNVTLEINDPAFAVEVLREASDGGPHAAHGYKPWGGRSVLRRIADQIEAQTRPPKPEPTELGAVVTDVEGREWVRTNRREPARWLHFDDLGFAKWLRHDEIEVPR